VAFAYEELSREYLSLTMKQRGKNDAKNEDEPWCCEAFQGDWNRKNSLFKIECKSHPNQEDIQKEADASKA
jgi:hypothetical protein